MENEIERKSRTQIKKEYQEIQKLGLKLTKLSSQQLKCLDLPGELMEALEMSTKIKSKPAAQRHLNHIGSLMKGVDPEPIKVALEQISAGKNIESEITIKTREWIEKLLTNDPSIIEDFLITFPHIERQLLRQLIKNALKEKALGKTGKSRKSLKGLKQLISKSLN